MNFKKIAMIPVALGSTRIKDKNLLLVNGNLLVSYVVEACKASGVFDEIYINSEDEIFKKIAEQLGVKFYKRSPSRGGSACKMQNKSLSCDNDRCQVHDHFIYDFLEKIPCDYLFMVHTTSPLLKSETIRNFVNAMLEKGVDSFFSCIEEKMEAFYEGNPINFDKTIKVPTQNLSPIRTISWAITGWKSKTFKDNYKNGPTFCGKTDFFSINKIEGLDIDTWEDLSIVESCLASRHKDNRHFYYDKRIVGIERDLQNLINRDGVPGFCAKEANNSHSNLEEIKEKMGKAPWCYLLAYSDSDQCCYICQNPGEGCRLHSHVTKDEWWLVLEGEFEWNLPFENKVIRAKKNETVFLPKGTAHKIKCIGDRPGIRLAHGGRDMEHIYYE